MNWSGKMWALTSGDNITAKWWPEYPNLYNTRADARSDRMLFYPGTKVVRVQVDVKVIE